MIYLKQTGSELVYQNTFEQARIRHKFDVIRLWEVQSEELLKAPGLWPFAVLAKTTNRESVLQDVARRIDNLSQRKDQSNLAASTAILAGLILDKGVIQKILREEIMRESVIYQEIKAEGKKEGLRQGLHQGIQQGLQQGMRQGIQQGEVALVLRQLNHRLGQISANIEEQIRQLSVEQLEELGEALLDFDSEADLVNWLKKC